MRITGGEFCGRILAIPKSDAIRPTQDRVRESVFAMLAPEIGSATFLDLFAGSGSVGLEALSRGAKRAVFVEASSRHVKSLRDNLNAILKNDVQSRAEVAVSDAYRWIERYAGEGFDIAFADPPYALGEERGYESVLASLIARGVVKPGGVFVAEMTAVQKSAEAEGWEIVRDRVYGKTRICIWRRKDEKRPE
ncbi:MAG: 16S rRNA (guanine(966)-N(2))-methyltransferase RsmD [Kiritimatiellae bacterium]|nr:16S rRNA (guanine(966)-N(2))-methyltransferase RsmD [Kiritimatiellia bacterium]